MAIIPKCILGMLETIFHGQKTSCLVGGSLSWSETPYFHAEQEILQKGGVEKENPNKKSKQMRVQEAFPVDYFVFSCIAPNFPAEKKWMWCWFQTI